ncbi:metallo-beta-lactamase domain protein [Aeromicrobium marinum DSM 15272]|uniref:Metallo-beta-lactamase domain protein n=1 Tax=Aeromicrobium marinum DSM 15272 TaxID=585531 RepID=E2SDT0_9ACTN|nr:MBL fold metallo-hydrolase [Aeromicrobium marinum]EFQ82657.1 metallo-beta-lactamase domain protein [Aeromicrobium marinum DSM 15272]
MRLTVVGCAGSYPGPDSAASCYLLETEHEGRTWRLVLDLGNGSLGQLQRYCDPRDVDGFAISHLHPDHCLDLTSYTVLSKYHPDGAYGRVPIHAPAGAAEYISVAGGPGGEPVCANLAFSVWEQDPVAEIGPFRVVATQVDHPVTAFGLRVEVQGHVVAYSGDTGPTPAIDDVARDADLFLCEASFLESRDNPPNLHLTGAEAGRFAASSGSRLLLVTHIPAWTDAAEVEADVKSSWDGDYRIVRPGDVFEV